MFPTKFRIEVEHCEIVFIFEAQSYTVLQNWMKALLANLKAGEARKDKYFV